jgi:uncharacterized protein YozE (UPF0346 family)
MKKVDDFETVYDMLEHAIEYAFEGKMQLKFYEFLKYRKPKARKIQAYLAGILEDAVRYRHDKRPGRRKKNSK